IAISVYVLVAIVKKTLNLDQSLYTILQILSLTLFEKEPIYQALSNAGYTNQEDQLSNQLNLFD
ncbi:MAG: IS4 family transposase, partial [Proteobacteria bacterium]|nr:IS4 family transposase [Pseudomonadota bacterium]